MAVRHTPPSRGVMKTEVLLVRIRDDANEVWSRGNPAERAELKSLIASMQAELVDEAFTAGAETDEEAPPAHLRVVSERSDP